jgi:dephospho-CoA kinase
MKKIGITGGIGSGKSIVCKVFELLGVPVYNADERAKNILDTDAEVLKRIVEVFGSQVLGDSGKVDRKKMASIVFNDKIKLEQLNEIVHPAVGKDFESWCSTKNKFPYVLKEAAILFESGSYKSVESVITVVAPIELRIKRVMDRDHVAIEDIQNRISKQMNDEEKIKRSSFVIMNDEQQLVIPQILEIHKQLSLYK